MTTISSISRYGLICVFHMTLLGMANAQLEHPDLVVAADGSGDYKLKANTTSAVRLKADWNPVIGEGSKSLQSK